MALEGLLAKLGPTVVREIAPHLVQLVSGFGERFRKDTRELKAAVDAEIASLGQSHAAVTSSVAKQSDAIAALGSQVQVMDRKVDRLLEAQEATARQLATLEEQVRAAPGSTRVLLWLTMFFSLLAFAVGVAALVLRR